jgi:hypothetical protein
MEMAWKKEKILKNKFCQWKFSDHLLWTQRLRLFLRYRVLFVRLRGGTKVFFWMMENTLNLQLEFHEKIMKFKMVILGRSGKK